MSADYSKTHISGAGVGLRSCHYQAILQHQPDIPWFEALSDNYLVAGGPALAYLRAIRHYYPITLHGVGLSIGSTDALDQQYLTQLKNLIDAIQPSMVSDHLCWTAVNKQHLHELLPLPYTQETINHVSTRIQQVQDFLKRPLLIENISSYLNFKHNEMPEWEFINSVHQKSSCGILLDVNNLYVNSINHRFDAHDYLNRINKQAVQQFHLAGYSDKKRFLFDAHNEPVQAPVWTLYQAALKRFGALPSLIEWDDDIPPLAILQAEAQKAQQLMDKTILADTLTC